MVSHSAFRSILSFALFFVLSAGIRPVSASTSHARIIRISVVQGDVRFTREAHGDPLADTKAVWEKAEANLPVRQGFVLATDEGRAEVEFENGAMAFLNANTVLEFYDLSLDDGARTTRLVLRQGSASFYVNSLGEDYFSVTGGDFTVVAASKGSFRINTFDDGSNVAVLTGRVSVLHKKETTALVKGQSLAMRAGEESANLGRLPDGDEFDHWVSSRIDTVSSASNASLQYTSSSFYAPGFADLYTYGAWNLCGGYGYGWRPFGAGFGWSPFSSGQWVWDPSFGWTYASYQPWGWAPYHYGGWLFDASCGGWFYSPPVVFFNPYGPYGSKPKKRPVPIVHPPRPLYRASTAVFVRQNGKLGIVPMNPLDKTGKSPLNLSHGVFSPEPTRSMAQSVLAANGAEKWETVKSPSRDALPKSLVSASAPEQTFRTMANNNGVRDASLKGDSSIVYDSQEHRFMSANALSPAQRDSRESLTDRNSEALRNNSAQQAGRNKPQRETNVRVASAPTSARVVAPPSRSVPSPPSRSSYGGAYGSYSGGGASSRGSSGPSAPASSSHVSAPSGGGGGGRPH